MPSGIYKRTKPVWNKGIKVGTSWHKGKKGVYSKETLKKMSDAKRGKMSPKKQEQISITCKECGIIKPIKYSERKTRSFCSWKCYIINKDEGKTDIREKIRASKEYKLWRISVFTRDNFTCVWCGDNKGGNLEADHIKPFALFPELRFAIDNGRTLCKLCHRKTDTYGMRGYIKSKNDDK